MKFKIFKFKNKKLLSANDGFTLTELLIALAILSSILAMASAIMLSIGKTFTKGTNSAKLQSTSRSLVTDITSAIQYGGVKPSSCNAVLTQTTCFTDRTPTGGITSNTVYSYCIGKTRYSFKLHNKLGNTGTPHVLWKDSLPTVGSICTPLNVNLASPGGTNGQELLGNNMRLTKFRVVPQPGPNGVYNIEINIAYGDDDLLNINTTTGKYSCKGDTGNEWCGVSDLSTTAVRRIE